MKKLTSEEYINRVSKLHNGKFDYSKTIYVNYRTKIIVICPKHGEFNILADNHLSKKQGCNTCAVENHRLTKLSTERVENLKKVHNNKYSYNDLFIQKGFINIVCPTHGLYRQYLYFHEYGHGCPECNSSSRGEDRVKAYLEINNINFIRNYQFEKCLRVKRLRFDFYLPDKNICVEYDGEHHYQENKYFGEGNLDYINQNDLIKNEYCKENDIKLIRIPYWNLNKIESILSSSFYFFGLGIVLNIGIYMNDL